MKRHRTAPAIALLVALVCIGSNAEAFDWPESLAWRPLFVGVEETSVTLTEPRPLRVHCLRVDLHSPGVRVCTNDSNGDEPEETNGLRTSSFLRAKQCQAAINAAPFWPGRKEDGEPQNVAGLVISRGEVVSPFDEGKRRAAVVFRSDVAEIVVPPTELDSVTTAVGGFGVVLSRGAPVRDESTPPDVLDGRHPRTAIGLTDGGRTLLMVVVDGRQAGYSEGVDLAELGTLMRKLGADDAVNLDGGGTSTMVVAAPGGEPRQVNRPIDGGVPGQERVAANHLGVYANPLPGGAR